MPLRKKYEETGGKRDRKRGCRERYREREGKKLRPVVRFTERVESSEHNEEEAETKRDPALFENVRQLPCSYTDTSSSLKTLAFWLSNFNAYVHFVCTWVAMSAGSHS